MRPLLPLRSTGLGMVFASACLFAQGPVPGFRIASPAFRLGGPIPSEHAGDGADLSPPLVWRTPPSGTRSFVLLCLDPDAPGGTWVHWVVYDISPGVREMRKGVKPAGEAPGRFRQGLNSWRRTGYGGPHPPPGKTHRYFFRLFALDRTLDLPPGASPTAVRKAMRGHVLGQTETMGTYRR